MENMKTTFDDAVDAYQKYCERNHLIFRQPSEVMSRTDKKYVYLENSYERLARYEIETGKIFVP
jgi:hypothetical protein